MRGVLVRAGAVLAASFPALAGSSMVQTGRAEAIVHHSSARAVKARRRGPRNPTCGRFCRQAGGLGDIAPGAAPVRPGVFIPDQLLLLRPDDLVGVRAECLLNHTCRGAMILRTEPYTYYGIGRDDLEIRAHQTKVVHVRISPRYTREIRRLGGLSPVTAGVWLSPTPDFNVSETSNLTILPAS